VSRLPTIRSKFRCSQGPHQRPLRTDDQVSRKNQVFDHDPSVWRADTECEWCVPARSSRKLGIVRTFAEVLTSGDRRRRCQEPQLSKLPNALLRLCGRCLPAKVLG
jgi:hypothetical protein